MRIPSNDISSDEESVLSVNSFFGEENDFVNNDKEGSFLEKNNSFNENFENFDINSTFGDDSFSVDSFSQEISQSSPEVENSENFLTKSLTVKEIIHSLTPISIHQHLKMELQ
ncbi:11085_t:CDS:1 [Cetraspora pellucida]|uniref:11085_t:CDS:1 n=1 Tax=Cetraspora pellucida TaxID=1433469 RepID=A0ACA9MIZ4_9GLOM|nr:11085_t:CDS:1 [Cetraspora pellucida]